VSPGGLYWNVTLVNGLWETGGGTICLLEERSLQHEEVWSFTGEGQAASVNSEHSKGSEEPAASWQSHPMFQSTRFPKLGP
jgi:hypothetical protein